MTRAQPPQLPLGRHPALIRSEDRILPFAKALALVIIPFLVIASVLLYLLPARTDELFAWTIAPSLTAMLLGSAYIGGIWFFAQVVRHRSWQRVKHGFPAVIAFASLLGIATFLHWDRFHFGHISFITWVALYVTTPLLALAALMLNRRADPGTAEHRDFLIPRPPRLVLAIVGMVALVSGLVLFFIPTLLVDNWAWQLTPLTARVVGAVLTLPGMVNIWLLTDARWSAFRWIFQAQLVSLVFIIGALVIGRADLDWTRPAAPLVVGGLALSLVAYGAFCLYCERGMKPR